MNGIIAAARTREMTRATRFDFGRAYVKASRILLSAEPG